MIIPIVVQDNNRPGKNNDTETITIRVDEAGGVGAILAVCLAGVDAGFLGRPIKSGSSRGGERLVPNV